MKLRFDPYQFEKITVNDVPVHFKHIPWANDFVRVSVLLMTGSRLDPEGKEGMAHFSEHMPFNGCSAHPSYDAIRQINRTLFLDTFNAATSHDAMWFHGKVDAGDLDAAMKFLADFLRNPLLKDEDFRRERDVIIREVWKSFKSEKLQELRRKIVRLKYGNHAFGRSAAALGWSETVANITVEDIKSFYCRHVHRGNMQIVMVGNIDVNRAASAASVFTSVIPSGLHTEFPTLVNFWPKAQPEWTLSAGEYLGLSGASLPQETEIQVFAPMRRQSNSELMNLTTQVISELLFREIRIELGATYAPRVTHDQFADHDTFSLGITVAPKALASTKKIISTIFERLAHPDEQIAKKFAEIKERNLKRMRQVDHSAATIIDNVRDELTWNTEISSLTEDVALCDRAQLEGMSQVFRNELTPDQLFWHVTTP